MMIFIVIIFAVAWLPYHVYFLLAHHFPEILDSPNVQHIYLAIYALAMSHSMSNPLILCWMNSRFRSGFRSVFCCVCLRSESAKQRYKQEYKKRSHFSECQTNQTRIRCTTISTGHTVSPVMTNGKVLRENILSLEAVNNNINDVKKYSSNRHSLTGNRQYSSGNRRCPSDKNSCSSTLNSEHQSNLNSNLNSNGQLKTNKVNIENNKNSKRYANQLNVKKLNVKNDVENEKNLNKDLNMNLDKGMNKEQLDSIDLLSNSASVSSSLHNRTIGINSEIADQTKSNKLNDSNIEVEID